MLALGFIIKPDDTDDKFAGNREIPKRGTDYSFNNSDTLRGSLAAGVYIKSSITPRTFTARLVDMAGTTPLAFEVSKPSLSYPYNL